MLALERAGSSAWSWSCSTPPAETAPGAGGRRRAVEAAEDRPGARAHISATSTRARWTRPRPLLRSGRPARWRARHLHATLRAAPTLVRLMPHDGRDRARRSRTWLAEAGVRSSLVVHDHGVEYGEPGGRDVRRGGAGARARRALAARLEPRRAGRPRTSETRRRSSTSALPARALSGMLARELHAASRDRVAARRRGGRADAAAAPSAIERPEPRSARASSWRQRAPFGFYGFEAMALILDAVDGGRGRPGGHRPRRPGDERTATRSSAATRSTRTA